MIFLLVVMANDLTIIQLAYMAFTEYWHPSRYIHGKFNVFIMRPSLSYRKNNHLIFKRRKKRENELPILIFATKHKYYIWQIHKNWTAEYYSTENTSCFALWHYIDRNSVKFCTTLVYQQRRIWSLCIQESHPPLY